MEERDSICVQSMDGILSFFEQESHISDGFLPNFLLPGPIVYISKTDLFITCNSQLEVESFRYTS